MDIIAKITKLLPSIIVFFAICFIIYQCARVHKYTVSNIGQYGGKDNSTEKKSLAVKQSTFNFYIAIAISFTIISAFLNLFNSTEVFVALFVAELTGLGVKLSLDLKS